MLPFWRCLGEKKRGTHLRLCKTKECDCRVCSNRSRIQHHSSQKWRQFHLFAEGSVLLESLQASGVQKQRRHGSKPMHVLTACAKLLCSSSMCKHVVCNPGYFLWIISSFSCIQQFQTSKLLGHRVPCRTVTVSYFRSGPQGDIGPILSSEDTEGSEDMSRVKTAVTFHALNKNPSPLGVKASITAPANYHQSHPAMEAKRRKVGDVYPPRGNRFQDKVDPGQQSAAEHQLSKILWKSKLVGTFLPFSLTNACELTFDD